MKVLRKRRKKIEQKQKEPFYRLSNFTPAVRFPGAIPGINTILNIPDMTGSVDFRAFEMKMQITVIYCHPLKRISVIS